MGEGESYLKGNVLVEPLFNQWYAWTNLIAPATAAMYVANQHLNIMRSFVAAPQMHVAALKNPAMMGGPFINYDASKAPAVKLLLEKTAREQAPLLALARAVKELDELLAAEAVGSALEPLYPRVPEELRGYVELVYDLNHHPSIRFIEGLLYRSPFYSESSQSLTLSLAERDERSFVFSTPRLEEEGRVRLRLPFRHAALDTLFRMKHEPGSVEAAREALGVPDADAATFRAFFTDEAPPPRPRFEGPGVRVRYMGHACLLIESADATVLVDPVVSYDFPSDVARFTFADLPERIDYVLITHNHQDHCMFETLLQLRHKVSTVLVPKNNGGGAADPSLKLVLRHVGFRDVVEIDELETIEVAGGAVTGLPFLGEHADLNIRTKIAYAVELAGRRVVCVADSDNVEPRVYEHAHAAVGDADAVFVGMECDGAPLSWLYGPLLTKPLARKLDQSRRSNGSDYPKAADLARRFNPKHVYVYAMGQEPWLTYLTSIRYTPESRPIVESDKLVADCRARGLVAERLFGCKDIMLD